MKMPEKILIIQTAYLWDVILTTPLVKLLKRKNPDSEIDVLSIPVGADVWRNNPNVKNIIVYDKRKEDKGIIPFAQVINKIREKGYDKIISPHRSLRSAVLAYLSGARERITFDKSTGSFLYNRIIPYEQNLHEVQRNLSLIGETDPEELLTPEIFPSEEEIKKVSKMLMENGLKNISFVGIAPGSVWYTKKWPEKYFVRLIKKLKEKKIPVALVGGKSDENLAEKIIKESGWGINFAGTFNPRESYELIRRSSCFITNDSAPLHLASAAGTPTIAIFGATVPEFGFGPYGTHKKRIMDAGHLSCRPCGIHGTRKCSTGTFACMLNVTPEKVWSAIEDMLDGTL